MKKDLTDITVVLDRSGSMNSCQKDSEGGLNAFIEQQKKEPGRAIFSLIQFDTVYEFVHKGVDIQTVGHCPLVPRGGTALLDAVGRAIVETGERLNKMAEADKPGLVTFVILTDGEENSSREYKLEQIKQMIEHQTKTYNWQFLFLGANADAFAQARGMGIQGKDAAMYSEKTAGMAYKVMEKKMSGMRAACMSNQPIASDFTDEERADLLKGQ